MIQTQQLLPCQPACTPHMVAPAVSRIANIGSAGGKAGGREQAGWEGGRVGWVRGRVGGREGGRELLEGENEEEEGWRRRQIL